MLTARLPPIAACLSLTRAIVRASSDEDIYIAAIDALSQSLDVSRAAILLFDADGVMRFKAWRHLSAAYRDVVEGHSPWTPDSPDPQTIVVPDVTTDPSLDGYRAAFAAEGIGALAFIPLVSMGRVIGKFMLYHDAPRALADDERQLAEMIAVQIAFALERSRAEVEPAGQRPAAAIRDRGRGHGHLGDGPRDANRAPGRTVSSASMAMRPARSTIGSRATSRSLPRRTASVSGPPSAGRSTAGGPMRSNIASLAPMAASGGSRARDSSSTSTGERCA